MKGESLLFTLLILWSLTRAIAQQAPVAPRPVGGAGYAKYKNRFYVLGGLMNLDANGTKETTTTNQVFALNLSRPWRSQTPAWIQLADGPRNVYFGAAISADGKILMAFPGNVDVAYRYMIEANTWEKSKYNWPLAKFSVSPVTLQKDGNVVTVGGYIDDAQGINKFEIYSFIEDRILGSLPLLPFDLNTTNYLQARTGYKTAWSAHYLSAVVYGGTLQGSPLAISPPDYWVSLYEPVKRQWRMLATSGASPPPQMTTHCIGITDDGKTLITHGGYGMFNNNTSTAKLYVLDLLTGVWTRGADSSSARGSATCTIAGDYFLLWGGFGNNSRVFDEGKASSPVLIYQISADKWVEEYQPSKEYLETPSASSTPPAPSSTEPVKPNSGSTLSTGAIVGIVIGAIAFLAAIVGGFLVWQRRKSSAQTKQGTQHPDTKGNKQYFNEKDTRGYTPQPSVDGSQRTLLPTRQFGSPQELVGYGYVDGGMHDHSHYRGTPGNNDGIYVMQYGSSPASMAASTFDPSILYQDARAGANDGHASYRSPHKVPSPRANNLVLRTIPHIPVPPTSPHAYIPPSPTSPHSYVPPPSTLSIRHTASNGRNPQGIEYGNPQAIKDSAQRQYGVEPFQESERVRAHGRLERQRRYRK